MKFIIIGRNIDITEGLKSAVQEKLGKLERYFTPETEIHVTLSVEKDRQKIEVTIPVKGNIIRSEQVSSDMYVSIDLVEEVIERQLRKYKRLLISSRQEETSRKSLWRTSSWRTKRLISFAPRSLVLNRCIRKTHACRWNCWDIIFMCSGMRRQMR